jgi:hypothetical protein
MTVSFSPLKANGQLFTHLPELDDLEVSLFNANAADVLDALGIEDSFSVSPWPLPCFKALLIVTLAPSSFTKSYSSSDTQTETWRRPPSRKR